MNIWFLHNRAIDEEEKSYIRGKLLERIEEEESQIAMQLAVALAKVGRVDFPKQWPNLFEEMMQRIRAGRNCGDMQRGSLLMKRNYLGLHLLLKELASKRLAQDQRTFEMVVSTVFQAVWEHWLLDMDDLVVMMGHIVSDAGGQGVEQGCASELEHKCLAVLERVLLQLKCIRRMVLFGYASDARTMDLVSVLGHVIPKILEHFSRWLEMVAACGKSRNANSKLGSMLKRGVIKLLKTLRQTQETHPWMFLHSGSLMPFLEMLCQQVSSPLLSDGDIGHAYMKQTLTAIYNVLKCPGYKGSSSSLVLSAGKAKQQKLRLEEMAAAAKPTLKTFWQAHAPSLLAIIVSKYFPLTGSELQIW